MLQVSEMYQRNAERIARDRSGQSHTATTDLDNDASEDDRQAARLRAEAEQAEAQKRERRIVVNLNKLGAAATGVRREFITTLLARKTLPKGAATFVADCLARDSYMLTQHNRDEVTAELLGIDAAAVQRGGQRPARGQRQPRPGDRAWRWCWVRWKPAYVAYLQMFIVHWCSSVWVGQRQERRSYVHLPAID